MADQTPPYIIADLVAIDHIKYTFTLETSYGLRIQFNQDPPEKDLIISLKHGSPSNPHPEPTTGNAGAERPGYKYRVFPDWGTTFIWYDTSWHGNPEGEYPVLEEETAERYGPAWDGAFQTWVDRYTEAFSKQECHLSSTDQHPFPDMRERKTWVLDGMMLAVWLSLQPDVASVEYSPAVEKVVFQKEGLEAAVLSFIEGLDKHLE
ncbi:hypothetical protein F4778DRAFT_744479 [Xylariomycetidae sp. FL2044]|nr:hypothetical protein F4778DRAFT_744479 [Xylariomycetidae sp. FL2044]